MHQGVCKKMSNLRASDLYQLESGCFIRIIEVAFHTGFIFSCEKLQSSEEIA